MTADLDLKGLPQLARMGKGLTAMNPDSTPGENLQAIIEAISTGQQRGLRRRGVYGLDFNYAERDKAYRDSGQRTPWVHQGHRPAWCCRRAMGANKQTRENRA
jgi:hypothetical protein